MAYTIPPNTRAVGSGNPPADMNNASDVLSGMGARYNVLNTEWSGGADPTGATDSTAAIQAAVNAGFAYIPRGTYMVSSTITIGVAGSGLLGHRGRWYHGTAGGPVLVPTSGFSGSSIINITAAEVEVGNLSIDCSAISSAAAIDGIQATGHILSGHLHDLLIRNAPRDGIQSVTSSGSPYSWTMRKVVVDGTGNRTGFNIGNMTDSMFDNCYAIACASSGWYLLGNGNSVLMGCRAEWSNTGYLIDGSLGPAFRMIGCSTDRNSTDGIRITTTGTEPLVISGQVCHRDGASSTTQYAGVQINSGTTNPIMFNNLAVYVGKNDDGTGNASPFYGVSVGGVCTHIQFNGAYLNGNTTAQTGITSGNGCHTRNVWTRTGLNPTGAPTAVTDIA